MAEIEKNENDAIDLKAELEKDLADEASDVEKYLKLADIAAAKYPHCGYDSILRDIAHEEKQHNKHIHDILMDLQKKEMTV